MFTPGSGINILFSSLGGRLFEVGYYWSIYGIQINCVLNRLLANYIQSMDKTIRPLQFHVALFIMNDLITNFTDSSHSSR